MSGNTQIAQRDQGAVTRAEPDEARRRVTLTPAVDIFEDSHAVIRAAHREALITAELATRASRRPNHGAEAKVLRRLAHALATSDAAMLDMLTLEAARLCRAASAGISVLESPPDKPASFRWVALAGHCAPLLNTYRPFDDSVCGVTLAMGKPELFKTPQRYFPSIEAVSPPVVEALLVPIPVGDGP